MKKGAKKKTASIRGELVVFLCLVFILTGMTIGFASYNKVLQTQGVATIKPQGIIHFTQLDLISYSNVDTNYQPSYTDTDLDFNLHFIEDDTSQPYSATYQITVQNDTFYNQTFLGVNYAPTIVDGDGNPIPSSNFSYVINGLSEGDIIASESSLTFTVTMTLNASSGDYTVDGEATIETSTAEETGSLLAALTGSTTGNLRNSNVRAPFTVHAINTHNTAQSFNLLLNSSVTSRYKLTDANGNNLTSFNISANSEDDYTFYVERLSGVTFCSDSETTSVTLLSTNNERANVGSVTLLLDAAPSCNDNEPPVISNVVLSQKTGTGSEGKAEVSWTGTDDSAITNYTVILYDGSGVQVGNSYNTGNDVAHMDITGLNPGTYYAKVYGRDANRNEATSTDINNTNCTANAGYCSRSSSVAMKWIYDVTYHLTDITSSNTASTVLVGTTYTTTLSANSTLISRKVLPNTITVTMGGESLSNYTYNSNSGAVEIPNVSGDIDITAVAANGCLVEGTMVKMADGTEKPIEDITYHDYVLVWSYAEGKAVARQPIWIEKEATATSYQVAEFSDGTSLKTVAGHGVFNVDLNRFVNVANEQEFRVGMHIYKIGEDQKLKSVEITNVSTVEAAVKYYHVVSTEFYNIFGDGVLSTDDEVLLSNLYGFEDDVKWPASRNEIIKDKNNLYDYADFDFMPRWMFDGLRVEEGRYLNNIGILPKDIFIDYLKNNQLNPDLYLPRE